MIYHTPTLAGNVFRLAPRRMVKIENKKGKSTPSLSGDGEDLPFLSTMRLQFNRFGAMVGRYISQRASFRAQALREARREIYLPTKCGNTLFYDLIGATYLLTSIPTVTPNPVSRTLIRAYIPALPPWRLVMIAIKTKQAIKTDKSCLRRVVI